MIEPDNTAGLKHMCMMPRGYDAPRAFSKLFFEAFELSNSRADAIDFCLRLAQDSVVKCGRCGTEIHNALWTREEIESFRALSQAIYGLLMLEKAIKRDYDERQPTCPACHHTAHLVCVYRRVTPPAAQTWGSAVQPSPPKNRAVKAAQRQESRRYRKSKPTPP